MNILLSGALGSMSRVTHQVAEQNGLVILAGVDKQSSDALPFPVFDDFKDCPDPDAIIDFSHPSVLPRLLEYAIQNHIPTVIGTTGMAEAEYKMIDEAAKKIPVFFTFNLSLGVNLLAALVRQATTILGEGYDIEIIEKHHNRKIDAPSGTAVMLANAIAQSAQFAPEFVYDRHTIRKPRDPREVGISSVRGGTIVGDHDVIFSGLDEIITISHSARSRGVFATGAIRAVQYISDKPPGLYDMTNLFQLSFDPYHPED